MPLNILPFLLLVQLVALAGNLWVMREARLTDGHSKLPPVGLLLVCMAAAIFVFALSKPALLFWDFRQAYYPAGRGVLSEPAALAPLFEKGVLGFVNLPIVAYFFAPFAEFDFQWGAMLFFVTGLAMVIGTWLLLVRLAGLGISERWMLLLLIAANGPLHYSLKEGNTAHMGLFALALGLYFLRSGRDIAAGAVLSIGALLKLPLLLYGVYFLLRRKWSAVFSFGAVFLSAALLSVMVFGWEMTHRWFDLCVRHGSDPLGAWNNQSIGAFFVRLFSGTEVLEDWSPHTLGAMQHAVGNAITLLFMAVAVIACWRGPKIEWHTEPSPSRTAADLEFQLVLLLALVTTPLAWTHYYAWLILPMAFFLSADSPIGASPVARRVAWGAIFLVTPIATLMPFSNAPLGTLYSKLVVSHVLVGGLIWFLLLALARARMGLLRPRELSRAGSRRNEELGPQEA